MILSLAAIVMDARKTNNWQVPLDHEIGLRVAAEVPWELKRIQIAREPRAHRVPAGVEFTHRGYAALLKSNNRFVIDTEAMRHVSSTASAS